MSRASTKNTVISADTHKSVFATQKNIVKVLATLNKLLGNNKKILEDKKMFTEMLFVNGKKIAEFENSLGEAEMYLSESGASDDYDYEESSIKVKFELFEVDTCMISDIISGIRDIADGEIINIMIDYTNTISWVISENNYALVEKFVEFTKKSPYAQ